MMPSFPELAADALDVIPVGIVDGAVPLYVPKQANNRSVDAAGDTAGAALVVAVDNVELFADGVVERVLPNPV